MSFSTIFSIIGWVLLIGLGLYVFYVVSVRSQRRPAKMSAVVVAVLLIGGIVMLTLGAGLVFIDQFEAGVVISPLTEGGVRPEPIGPGIHFVTPFIESVNASTPNKNTMSGAVNEGAANNVP
jgi:regulator of protease activity HflC (stomatin/prohibitin superfamily)